MNFIFSHIVNKLLTENVDINLITQVLNNHNYVEINYAGDGESGNHRGKRIIQVYAYGLTKGGKPCIRAYQTNGDTYRGRPKWKLFRIDRILSWKILEQTFNEPPKEQGWQAEEFNKYGDNSMSTIFQVAQFNNFISPLEREKNKTKNMSFKPINISDLRGEKGRFNRQYNQLKKNVNQGAKELPNDIFSDKYWNNTENDNLSNNTSTSGPLGKDINGNDTNDINAFQNTQDESNIDNNTNDYENKKLEDELRRYAKKNKLDKKYY